MGVISWTIHYFIYRGRPVRVKPYTPAVFRPLSSGTGSPLVFLNGAGLTHGKIIIGRKYNYEKSVF